ncbi:MAG TPA: D-aminoacyl-tRNA deacylase [Candidatus Nanoarchaeia archaeon]|nr:D-aminoacyl-tRNA deacylase [Candidatus Nanoarchaeia archaeon]
MDIKLILSKRIESDFRLPVYAMLRQARLPLIEIDDFPLYLHDEDLPPADAYIAVAIHSLPDINKCFCVHSCGNWNAKWPRQAITDLGGKERTLCGTSSSLFTFLYHSLRRHNTLPDFSVRIEATHHGPAIRKPILMLEIGSGPEAWQDARASETVFAVIQDVLDNFRPRKQTTLLVIGGDHYMQNAEPLLTNPDIAFGHLCPSSQVPYFTREMLLQAVCLTREGVDSAAIDVAGVGQYLEPLIRLFAEQRIPYDFVHALKKTSPH